MIIKFINLNRIQLEIITEITLLNNKIKKYSECIKKQALCHLNTNILRYFGYNKNIEQKDIAKAQLLRNYVYSNIPNLLPSNKEFDFGRRRTTIRSDKSDMFYNLIFSDYFYFNFIDTITAVLKHNAKFAINIDKIFTQYLFNDSNTSKFV